MRKIAYTFFLVLFFVTCVTAQEQEGIDSTASPSVFNKTDRGDNFLPVNTLQNIEQREVPRKTVDEVRKNDAYWYANAEPQKEENSATPQSGATETGWLSNLIWILILVSFIGVVIWYLASSNVGLFRKAPKKVNAEEQTEITEDIFELNFDKEIGKAVDAKNYRLAVRLWYLRILKDLADRNIITYGREKTNSYYLLSLFGGRYYNDFFRLTRNFEYTWYGQFPLAEDSYALMQKDFAQFKNSLP